MNKDQLLSSFIETFSELENTIRLFSYENFNQIPFEGSWTPGQVCEHIKLASANFAKVLTGEVEVTTRSIDEKVAILKDIFLNYDTKMKSPNFIDPQLVDYDRDAMLNEMKKIKNEIAAEIPALDLSKTCLSFELPKMGHLTRLEAIYFVIYHTQRHLHQLKNCYQYLKSA